MFFGRNRATGAAAVARLAPGPPPLAVVDEEEEGVPRPPGVVLEALPAADPARLPLEAPLPLFIACGDVWESSGSRRIENREPAPGSEI